MAAASPEFTNDINVAYESAIERPATAVELAAAQSDLGAGLTFNSSQNTVTVATLRTQIAELSGGAPPQVSGPDIDIGIRPQTILGRRGFIYGLPNNVELVSAQEMSVSAEFHGPGDALILLIPKQQAASFSDLTLSQTINGPGDFPITHIGLHGGATINLQFTQGVSLSVANYQFVQIESAVPNRTAPHTDGP